MIQLVNSEGFSLGLYQDEAAILKEKNKGAIEVPICEQNFIVKKWSFSNEVWMEGATNEEIIEYNKSLVPQSIPRMKFKMQVRRTTYYTYEIIIAYIQNMAVTEEFTEEMKADILDRLEDCTHFERYNPDFIMLANAMNVSDAKKDEIFIEGNKIV